MADNSKTYAEDAADGSVVRFDSTPAWDSKVIQYLLDNSVITQQELNTARAAVKG